MNDLLHWLLGAFCHQLPERSLTSYGTILPLCARCTGLHIAAAATLLYLYSGRASRGRTGLPTGSATWALAALTALWLVDGVNSTVRLLWQGSLYPPHNALRLLTGLGMGVSLAMILYPLLQEAFSNEPQDLASARDWTDLLGPLLVSSAAVGLVMLLPWAAIRAVLLALAALSTLSISNVLAVALLPVNAASRRARSWWIAGLGVGAALLEITLLLLLRRWLGV